MALKGDPSEWRARNGNLVLSSLPPDGLELMKDPRVEAMTDPLPGFPPTSVELRPADLASTASRYLTQCRYLTVSNGLKGRPRDFARWVNMPACTWGPGWGLGFDDVTERPRIEQPKKAPKRLFHLWSYDHFFVASPDMVELFEKECPGSIQTLPIDWIFNDGSALDGYVFLDFVKLHHAWDYRRSTVIVEMSRGRKHLRLLSNSRTVREDIPADIKVFRDAYQPYNLLISRDLASHVAALADRELSFEDANTGRTDYFPRPRGRRRLQARLKQAALAADDESMPLTRRLLFRVAPLLKEGGFAAAEALLTEWLQARAATPYHIIADLRVTTLPEECAAYLDEFCLQARKEYRLETVYVEMNGFTINPDLWFCDAFGFNTVGDDEGDAWLGHFQSGANDSLVIAGLEALQAVFDTQMQSGPLPPEYEDARALACALVVVKFQRLLQAALPLTKHLQCPLWATAHDHYEYLTQIQPQRE